MNNLDIVKPTLEVFNEFVQNGYKRVGRILGSLSMSLEFSNHVLLFKIIKETHHRPEYTVFRYFILSDVMSGDFGIFPTIDAEFKRIALSLKLSHNHSIFLP